MLSNPAENLPDFHGQTRVPHGKARRASKETVAPEPKNRHKSPRMVQTVISDGAATGVSTARDQYLKAFRWMLLARLLDEKFASLYRGGKIHGGVFLGRGQEAL